MSHCKIFVRCPDCNRGRYTDSCALRRARKAGRPLRCSSCAARVRQGHTLAVVARAKLLYSRGYSAREVAEHLADENIRVPRTTVSHWVAQCDT